MAQRQPRKEDVMSQFTRIDEAKPVKKSEPNGTRPAKKPKERFSLELGVPGFGKVLTLGIGGDCKTIVDWVNGHAKLKTRESTVANTQNLLREWWGRRSTNDNALPIGPHMSFVSTIKKLICELVDTAHVVCWRSSASVGFGMAAAMTENAGPVF